MQDTLIVLVGPTAVGKTDLSVRLAEHFKTPIISADSRQIYKGLKIGTASPEPEYLERVQHHFIECKALDDYYNASAYETEVLDLLTLLFKKQNEVLLTGGSMMYVDAVVKGIDEMPDADQEIRAELIERFQNEGLEPLRIQLKTLDPVFYSKVDLKNHSRIIHALEISIQTGKPYSSFLTNQAKERPFNVIKVGIDRDRKELYERINQRVLLMIEEGLEEEAKVFQAYRHCNALNTVGYKEMFAYLDGEYDLDRAVELIQRNSRRYAKKQLTWFRRDQQIQWFHPDNMTEIIAYVERKLSESPQP